MSDEALFRWSICMLAHLASELHHAWCAGSVACRERWQWLSAPPQPGDLVVEITLAGYPQGAHCDHFTRIGRYLGEVEEERTDSEGDAWTARFKVIVLADGSLFRWTNADLRRVPEEKLYDLTGQCLRYGWVQRVSLRSGYVSPDEWATKLGIAGQWYDGWGWGTKAPPHERAGRPA